MRATHLRNARRAAGLTQTQLANKLGKSQGYVSLLERGQRNPSASVATRLAVVLNLPPTARPLRVTKRGLARFDANRTARSLATLGYPGFAYLGSSDPPRNPAEVLLRTLAAQRMNVRVFEAMPWLLLHFADFDRKETLELAHLNSLQNRFGFVVSLARDVARHKPRLSHRLPELDRLFSSLEPLRLAREDDLGQAFRSERLRDWVRRNRTKAAVYWNLLTDLGTEHLAYANQ
jgi:transcriptional regulator with XRE-family HTH domain